MAVWSCAGTTWYTELVTKAHCPGRPRASSLLCPHCSPLKRTTSHLPQACVCSTGLSTAHQTKSCSCPVHMSEHQNIGPFKQSKQCVGATFEHRTRRSMHPHKFPLGADWGAHTSSASVLSKKVVLGILALLLCSALKTEDDKKLEKCSGCA